MSVGTAAIINRSIIQMQTRFKVGDLVRAINTNNISFLADNPVLLRIVSSEWDPLDGEMVIVELADGSSPNTHGRYFAHRFELVKEHVKPRCKHCGHNCRADCRKLRYERALGK